jgi:arabinose-5-phosphate isomerase
MSRKKLGMTCVVDGRGRLLGIITDGDLRRMVRRFRGAVLKRRAGACMTADPIAIEGSVLATEALNLMERRRITSLVVRAADGRVAGVIHLHDLWRTEMF